MESHPSVKLENNGSAFQLFACRVCLATETKLFNLHKYQLVDEFGDLTGTQVSRTDGLPQYICSICCTLLRKSSAFRAKCRQVHVLLQDARVRQPMMTTSYIKSLDTKHLKLPLTQATTYHLSYPHEWEEEISQDIAEPEQNPLIKVELLDLNFDNLSDDWNKDTLPKTETLLPIQEIKKDSESEDTFIDVNPIPDTEEKTEKIFVETISTRILESKSKPKRRVTRKRKPDEESDTVTDVNPPETSKDNTEKIFVEAITTAETNSKPKRKVTRKCKQQDNGGPGKQKRRYNQKFLEDFEDFKEKYNCDVMFLTKEQQIKEVQERKDSDVFRKSRFKCNICYKGFMNISAHTKHMNTHDKMSGDHVCDVCFIRFKGQPRLTLHLKQHRNRFVCKTCDYVNNDSTQAKYHFRWHQGHKYECKECNKEFNKLSTHMNHRRFHHSPLKCQVCDETVSGTKGLEEHNQKIHSGAKFPCIRCKKQFESQEAFDRHLNPDGVCFGKNCPCTKCGETFPSKPQLHDHRESVHNETLYRCDQCPDAFKTGRKLAAHWAFRHASKFMCEVCARIFSNVWALRVHQAVHRGKTQPAEEIDDRQIQKVPCETCKKQFDSPEALDMHLAPDSCNKDPCTKCGEGFEKNRLMLEHREAVHGETLYRCNECPEVFTKHRSMAVHWTFKHSKASFLCDVCARSYKSEAALKGHRRTHFAEDKLGDSKELNVDDSLQGTTSSTQQMEYANRPFECPICPKRFTLKVKLKIHMNTHTGERPIKCNQCDAAFKSYSQRYKHNLMVHKKERRHKCHLCEKAYVVSCDLKMHIRTFHMKIPRLYNRRKNRNKANNN